MDDYQKRSFDALMTLADFRLKRAFDRRQHEWKVTLGVWALLASAIVHPLHGPIVIIIIAAAIVTSAHLFLWIRPHWVRSTKDLKMAFWFAEISERKFFFSETPPPEARPKGLAGCDRYVGFLFYPTSAAQSFTTITLAAIVVLRWAGCLQDFAP